MEEKGLIKIAKKTIVSFKKPEEFEEQLNDIFDEFPIVPIVLGDDGKYSVEYLEPLSEEYIEKIKYFMHFLSKINQLRSKGLFGDDFTGRLIFNKNIGRGLSFSMGENSFPKRYGMNIYESSVNHGKYIVNLPRDKKMIEKVGKAYHPFMELK